MQRIWLPPLVLLLGVCACGPSKVSGEDQTGDAETATGGEPEGGSESETESETGTTNTTFVPNSDDNLFESCDPWMQDCPEGEKCVPFASSGGFFDANKCVPITGEQAPGEPCIYDGPVNATDDCDATSMCWYVEQTDDGAVGSCVAFCEGSPDTPTCADGYYCPIASDGTINICLPTCDPVAGECADGQGCYWANGEFTCYATLQGIPIGESCGYINDCVPGAMCLNAEVIPGCEGSACCGEFCDLALGDGQCEALPGTVCAPFFEDGTAPPQYQHVGVCIVP